MARIVIRRSDLRRETFRAGGKGGQHQNKTESAVRYTHLPTGLAAEARGERSQSQNDAIAMRLLLAKIVGRAREQAAERRQDDYRAKPDAAFSSQIRSYVLHGSLCRVVDHRTGFQASPGPILRGRIDAMLRARLSVS